MAIDPKTMLERCDTLMLDMDGTVLDLAFDNYVWKELVPSRFAALKGMSFDEARTHLFAQYEAALGNLEWYCLDHWSDRLGFDMLELHRDVNDRIGYLPGAREFLKLVRERDIRIMLVTNSHRDTLALKNEVTGLFEYFDGVYSSHDFGHAKERREFWQALEDEVGFGRRSTLFVDDTTTVLGSARRYGLDMLVNVTLPDSSEPRRDVADYAGVERIADLL